MTTTLAAGYQVGTATTQGKQWKLSGTLRLAYKSLGGRSGHRGVGAVPVVPAWLDYRPDAALPRARVVFDPWGSPPF